MIDVLAIGAHPDDVELGMGATIAKLVRLGFKAAILDLTDGEPTPYGSKELRLKESLESAKILKVERSILSLPNRYLLDTIENRKEIAGQIRKIRPKIVFAHYWVDRHPDHIAASQLSEAAVFYSKLTKSDLPGQPLEIEKIYYFYPFHLRLSIKPSFIMDVSEDFSKKIESLKAYQSQFIENQFIENQFIDNEKNSPIFDYLRKQSEYLGSLIKRSFGEAFISKETVGISSIFDLI
ncbi:bacillithiol biosynthesis deacetylase BshB1 [bacterium]|nr:bacillithiol biosynthesis deacetylase BshB1 [bacterium]MBU0899227.1 bacillithiol biosynthesis deacetylase BshB1 [bacterium]MBU1154048.1 bacillithiol biosynthesis deacetylase BshB1 [bacterium]MBU1782533.1 bacillithiol biosynthesis deacetylase BshB1 [bacterium]